MNIIYMKHIIYKFKNNNVEERKKSEAEHGEKK